MADRIYSGKKPSLDDGWQVRCSMADECGVMWVVYSKPQPHSDVWVTYKIVADGKAPKKANYWVVRNSATGRLAYPADIENMREHRPHLHKQTEKFFETESEKKTR